MYTAYDPLSYSGRTLCCQNFKNKDLLSRFFEKDSHIWLIQFNFASQQIDEERVGDFHELDEPREHGVSGDRYERYIWPDFGDDDSGGQGVMHDRLPVTLSRGRRCFTFNCSIWLVLIPVFSRAELPFGKCTAEKEKKTF